MKEKDLRLELIKAQEEQIEMLKMQVEHYKGMMEIYKEHSIKIQKQFDAALKLAEEGIGIVKELKK